MNMFADIATESMGIDIIKFIEDSKENIKNSEEKHFSKDEVLLILSLIQKQVDRLK